MTHRAFTNTRPAGFIALAACFVWIACSFAPAARILAQEDASAEAGQEHAAVDPLAQQPAQQRIENPASDPLNMPTKDDWRNQRQRRDQQTLFGPPTPGQADRQQAMRMKLEKQMRELQRQQEQLARERTRLEEEFRRAMAQYEQFRGSQIDADARSAELQQQLAQLEAARAQMAEMVAGQQRGSAPLPKDAKTSVFSLRSSRAPEVAGVIAQVVGDRGLRMGVDERTNSLIVSAGADTLGTVEALLQQLDKDSEPQVERGARETLQLRIVWLLDIDEGLEPTAKLVSPQVVEALRELGFSAPKVVCQQMTTLTLSDRGRRGQFDFELPVLIKSQPWQLEGHGRIESMADARFSLMFDLGFRQMNVAQGGGRGPGAQARLGGSIYTPLGHYTVMGTTTFVATLDLKADQQTRDASTEQYLSAFVVYLDRAREFSTSGADAEKPRR